MICLQFIMYTNFIDGRVKDLKSSLKTYLFSIGKNLILNEFKRRGQYEEFKDIHISNKLAELDQIEVENEHTRKMTIVREAVSVLKDPCKSILTYFYWAKKKLDVILTLMPNYNSIDALKVQKYKCMQGLIIEEIRRRENFFSIIKSDTETWKIFSWKTMSIAAMLIGIFILVYWQPNKYSNKEILNTYAYNYSNESPIEQNANEDDDTRSSARSDMNFSQQEVLVLVKAKALYENQHFELATAEFEKIGNLIKLNPDLSMLMAYSQLKAGMYEKASMNYTKLVQNSDISFQQEAKYYLALALIGSNDRKGARIVLKDIIKSKELHSEDAKKILKTMRWF